MSIKNNGVNALRTALYMPTKRETDPHVVTRPGGTVDEHRRLASFSVHIRRGTQFQTSRLDTELEFVVRLRLVVIGFGHVYPPPNANTRVLRSMGEWRRGALVLFRRQDPRKQNGLGW